MTELPTPLHLSPESVSEDDGAAAVAWRIGPGLVRFDGAVTVDDAPGPVADLLRTDILSGVRVEPGRIVTRFGPGRTPSADGRQVRSALYAVLSAPGGWPEPGGTDDVTAAEVSADREIAAAVTAVLDDEFSAYTASHGGAVELLGVRGGVVRVALRGRCHGCPAAGATVDQNLAGRLRTIPGFRGLAVG